MLNRSLYQYNASFTITSIQGTYTVKIIANDTLNNINSSENTTFSLGDIAVPTIVLNAPANYSNHSSTSIIFNFTATDDVSAFLNCSILINQTVNQTNNSVVSTADTLFNISGFLDASYSWNVTCNDSSGKNGSSEIRIFNIDTHPPEFQSLVTVPSDEANLDPNANITALANVTDNTTSVQTVILQYKLSNNSEFTNLTLPLYSNSNLYNNSFNATQNGTYNLRLWANDSVGNAAFSNLINIGVVLEKNWTRTPVSFPAVRTTLNSNVSVGNLTINNTGDFALHFNISSTSNETYYNASSNFTLQAGEVRAIEVLDNGSASGIKTLTLNITVNDSEARPQSLTTTGTIVVAPGQPLLVATFTEPDADTLAVTQGDTNILFAATLNNIGEGNASNVSFFFTIPEEWTVTFGSTSESLTELLSGESEDNVFEVTIPSNATAGTYKVYVNATGINASGANLTTINLTFGDVITVTVNQAAEILGTAGGGGAAASTAAAASSAAGGGGGGAGTVTKVPRETIDFPEEYVSVPRSTSYTIPVTVTNTWINATLKDISLVLEGFLAQQVQVSPSLISSIASLESREFFLTINVPSYFQEAEYPLTVKITGNLVAEYPDKAGFTTKAITEIHKFILKVESIVTEELVYELTEVKKNIVEMKDAGFYTEGLDGLLSQAEELINADERTKARQLLAQIESLRKDAYSAQDIIGQVKASISIANEKWLDVPQTEEALQLALLAMERGDFSTALERAKNAQLIYVLETKGRINLLRFMIDWWWALLLGSMLVSLSGFFIYKKSMVLIIDQRLHNIDKEEEALQALLEDAQREYLVEKKISQSQYNRMVKQYDSRLTKIRQVRLKLRNQRVAILKTKQELSSISKEKKELQELMKKNQQEYFMQGKIGRSMFLGRQDQYKGRLAELDKEEMLLQERLAKEIGTKKYTFLAVVQKAVNLIEGLFRIFKKDEKASPDKVKEKKLKKKEEKVIADKSGSSPDGTKNEKTKGFRIPASSIFNYFFPKDRNVERKNASENTWVVLTASDHLKWQLFLEKTNIELPEPLVRQDLSEENYSSAAVSKGKPEAIPGRLSLEELKKKFPGAFG